MKTSAACLLLFLTVAAAAAPRTPPPPTAQEAKALYQALTRLSGRWASKSTKGWTETSTFEVIAKGSAVVNRSRFEGEPNDGMLTVFHLDGGRLLLTHYCEARNQPTLVASKIGNGGKHVEFTFVSATGLRSPDAGHMHSMVLDLVDGDHFRSRWSWFAAGSEQWFEDVESVRVP
jgi:hypothetical protein